MDGLFHHVMGTGYYQMDKRPKFSLSQWMDDFMDDIYAFMLRMLLWGCAIALGFFLSGVAASVVVFALMHLTAADTGTVVTVGKFIGFAGTMVIALSVIYRLVVLFSTGISKLRFGASDFLALIGVVVGIASILIGHYWK